MIKPRPESAGFELQVTQGEESFAWTSESVNQLLLSIEEGYKPKSTPFYEGNPNLRKGNIVFNYTNEELQEIKKCAKDIVYFANNYCTVMTDDGLSTITLRDYQENMLNQFQKERFNVCLASRQIGKCLLFSTEILLLRDGIGIKTTLGKLYFESLKLQRKFTLLERIKYFLWKAYEKLDLFDKKQDKY
jgi:hypothetical protein